MKKFLSAAALTVICALPSAAATLNGTFTIEVRNFTDADPGADVEYANSGATVANFLAVASDAVFTYTGNIDFGIPGSQDSNVTKIAGFLASGGGVITDADAGELAFLAGTLLSQGTYVTTTFFKITGTFASAVAGTITHDDGVTLVAIGQTGGVSSAPTTVLNTAFSSSGGAFTLYYAAANGNPSVLKVDVSPVPLPAGGLLLIGALGGLAALRRRKAA